MKSNIRVGGWRPVMGVAVVGALALGVSALAAPRVADQAGRGTGKGGTDVTRLVTGAPAQINAVVAGTPPSAVLSIDPAPVPTSPGPIPPNPYPAGVTISGNTMSVDRLNKDGFRAWFKVHLKNWDPDKNGSPAVKAYQIKIDCSGYMASDCVGSPPLTPPAIACTTNPVCREAFGESWAKCELGICKAGYLDFLGTGAPADAFCEADGGGCSAGDVATGNCNFNYFSVADAGAGRPETLAPGTQYDGGTLVLDMPAGAKGKYTVNLNTDETFLADNQVPPVDIPTLTESGFVVNFITGSCCFGLGTPGAGCVDDCVNRSDCDALAGPRVFTPGALCSAGCVECAGATQAEADALCNDGDACTTESCNRDAGVCNRGSVSGWVGGDQLTNCCNPTNGDIDPIDDGNACTDDACSLGNPPGTPKPGNGIPTHTPSSVSTPCNDNNPCSVGDHCAGPPATTCTGDDVNDFVCVIDADCPLDPLGAPYACVDGKCFCTLTPEVTFDIPFGDPKRCAGGPNAGGDCNEDADCPLSYCNLFFNGANCFDEGEKVTANVHIAAAGSPINGGQFLMKMDLGGCMELNSVVCLPPYSNTVYGPIVNNAEGTIFIACGVDPFAGIPGPLGNVDMLSLSFNKIGECNECELCFGTIADNPRDTYLVDDEGQRVSIDGDVCKKVRSKSVLTLDVPDSYKTNADCDGPTALESWTPPSVSDSCSTASLVCRGAHTSGYSYNMTPGAAGSYFGGGELPGGSSSFCCYAVSDDACGGTAGCSGAVNSCGVGQNGKPEGCWTVEVNDETSLDVDVQLCPPLATTGELTRCIKFCLYANCAQDPICYYEDVTFGGLFEFIGKSRGKIKVNGSKQWGCITAQDQLHTLRSCYTFGANDCDEGQLHAQFSGDHAFDGNCLLGGNLDGWKKDVPGSDPSLDVIDILDYGTFISQFGNCYGDGNTPCGTTGPNADINGDGCVTTADYNFVITNFLTSAKDCCCGPQASSLPPALAEVTIDELRQMGLGELAVADLNGDGVLNADDMDAFMQGARPAKSNDRKGGKGLRSGR